MSAAMAKRWTGRMAFGPWRHASATFCADRCCSVRRIDVDEDRLSTDEADGFGRGEKGKRSRDDFVAGPMPSARSPITRASVPSCKATACLTANMRAISSSKPRTCGPRMNCPGLASHRRWPTESRSRGRSISGVRSSAGIFGASLHDRNPFLEGIKDEVILDFLCEETDYRRYCRLGNANWNGLGKHGYKETTSPKLNMGGGVDVSIQTRIRASGLGDVMAYCSGGGG